MRDTSHSSMTLEEPHIAPVTDEGAGCRHDDDALEDASIPAFKLAEKRYKLRRVAINRRATRWMTVEPDLCDVLDVVRAADEGDPRITELEGVDFQRLSESGGGEDTRVFCVRDHPGFYLISNGLGVRQQGHWAWRCLSQFSRSPHTNLTSLHGRKPEFREAWEDAVRCQDLDSVRRLRWANLGKNYVWGSRVYGEQDDEGIRGEDWAIPSDLKELAKAAAELVGFSIEPEAGIVNFYPRDGVMGGHVDDAEEATDNPIVSFSVGQSAVYLLGGRSKTVAPTALLVRSGDVMVQGGESRMCFHGVPCILSDSAPDELLEPAVSLPECPPEEAALVVKFFSTSRINFNVRQVKASLTEMAATSPSRHREDCK